MWRSSYLFLKKPSITLVIFRGWWGEGSGSPDPPPPHHQSMNSEIKRIGRNDRYSQMYGCSIAASVYVLLWTKFKYNKGQKLLNYAKESYHGSLYTVSLLIEIYLPLLFQDDTCYTCSCCVMLRTQFKCEK